MKLIDKIKSKLNNNPVYVQTKALKSILCNEPEAVILAIRKLPTGAITIRSVNTNIDSTHGLCCITLAHNYLTAAKKVETISPEEYAQRVAETVLQHIKAVEP